MAARYGLAEFISHRPLLRRVSRRFSGEEGHPRAPKIIRESFGERLRQAFVELGPTFIKFGQLLSDRKDILPEAVLNELAKLQDKVPPFSTEEAKSLVEQELGDQIDRLFIHFTDEPDAAASLAQVHRAILPIGTPVAVKIKRPGIDDQVRADIQIMRGLASFIDNNTSYFQVITAEELVEEFEHQMLKELDFTKEFLNIEKFRDDFASDETIHVPEVFPEYNTYNLLVMEYIHGKKISEVIESEDPRFDKKLLNRRNADFLMNQLFINGFFHADPHPGNFIVIEGNVICYIDFGMAYSLRPYELENLNYMMIGLSRLDPLLVSRSLLRIGKAEGRVDEEAFESAVHDYIEEHLDKPLEFIDVSRSLIDLLQLVVNFGIRIPPRLVYVAKVLGTLQTVGAGLDPEFRILQYLKEFSPHIWANQMISGRAGNKALVSGLNWGDALTAGPDIIQSLRRFMRNPEVNLRSPQADEIRETYDKVGFRMTFGMVLSSVLISSSLVVLADIEPKLAGIPLFGIIGFGLGSIMGLGFLFAGLIKLFRWHHRE